jgi:TPR repeat protein
MWHPLDLLEGTYAYGRRRQKKVTHMRFNRKLGWLVLPVLLVVGGATTGAVLANGVVKWAYAVVAVVATGCGVAANQWLASAPELTLRLRDGRRGAPVFYDVAMTNLGVHRSRLAWASGETYVERDIDHDVRAAVSTGQGLVLLHGAALAGKTRTLVEAVGKTRPGVRLVAFEPGQTATLARRLEQARRWKRVDDYDGVVLWLDRIGGPELFEITTDLLNSAERHGVQLLATAVSHDVEAAEHCLPEDPRLAVIRVGAVSETERDRLLMVPALREVTEAHAGTPLLLGRLLVSLEKIERYLTPTTPDDQERLALVRAVLDWHWFGVPLPLTKHHLAELFPLYLAAVLGLPRSPGRDPARLERVLQDGLRRRDDLDQPLIYKYRAKQNVTFHPHPLLAALADSTSPAAWPLQPQLWTYLYGVISGPERRQLGLYAYGRGLLLEASELLIVDIDSSIDPIAMRQLGYAERDVNLNHARIWWQRAVGSGHPDQAPYAMVSLGFLEKEQGDVCQAGSWWQGAVGSGHPDQAPRAMVSLGYLAREQGDVDQARSWWQQAVDSGHPDYAPQAIGNLGVLARAQGDVDQARSWWQRAVDSGHPDYAPRAMVSLGYLAREQGDVDQARSWWQRAVDSGHPDQAPRAMAGLGYLASREQGDIGLARSWYQQAVDSGHPDQAPRAMVSLGVLGKEQGDIDQARSWYQQAVDSGHPDQVPRAMVNLGVLEKEQGNIAQARSWYQQAANSSHPDHAPMAMFNLGNLEKGQHNVDQARSWYRRVIDSGHPNEMPSAMVNLGNLEKEQGNVDQARSWYQRAVDSGHTDQAPRAMVSLGILETEQGDIDQARSWWQCAIDSSHSHYSPQAEKLLRTLAEFEHEQQQAEWIARTGSYIDENWAPPRS